MELTKKHIVTTFILLLGLSLYTSSSYGVLCVGFRGDVKVETAHLKHCCSADITTPTIAVEDDNHDHDCVDCSDFTIDTPQLLQRIKFSDKPSKVLFAFSETTSQSVLGIKSNLHSKISLDSNEPNMVLFSDAITYSVLLC